MSFKQTYENKGLIMHDWHTLLGLYCINILLNLFVIFIIINVRFCFIIRLSDSLFSKSSSIQFSFFSSCILLKMFQGNTFYLL